MPGFVLLSAMIDKALGLPGLLMLLVHSGARSGAPLVLLFGSVACERVPTNHRALIP